MNLRSLLAVVAVFLCAGVAEARSVFLNNVNIDGLTSQKFENCSVEIDAKGNVYITAKGYKVEVAPPPGQAPPTEAVTKRYWLVTEKPSPGMDQYEIEVFINSQFVKRVLSKDEQIYLEVTKFVHAGNNQVYIIAKKVIENNDRKSTAPSHYSRIIIGEGDVAGRTIMIEKQLLDYKRTAAETTNFADQFNIEAR